MKLPLPLSLLVLRLVDSSWRVKNEDTCRRLGLVGVHLSNDVVVRGDVSIGEGTWIGRDSYVRSGPHSKVTIGRECGIGSNVLISSWTHRTEGPHIRDNPYLYPETKHREADITIGDRVWLCNDVVITPGHRVGDRAVVGANSVVTHDVPEGWLVGGVPARPIKPVERIYAVDMT